MSVLSALSLYRQGSEIKLLSENLRARGLYYMHSSSQRLRNFICLGLSIALLGGQCWLPASAQSAFDDSATITSERSNYESQLADLESQFGPYHRSLLEPLQSLVAIEQEQGNYVRVAELQSRQLQVMRTVLGFRHPDLIPLVDEIIANEIRLENWEGVSEQLDHKRYLVTSDTENSTKQLLNVVEQQAFWHLERVQLDARENRARNFMMARDYYEELVDLAEAEYGEDTLEMVPWLYKFAMSEYRLVELLNADDGVSADTIERLIQKEGIGKLQASTRGRVQINTWGINNYIPVVEGDALLGEAYLRDSLNSVRDIGKMFEEAEDLEAQAMTEIYEADFMRIMGRGSALQKYRDAQEKLLQAGVAAEKIERFFNQPAFIPVPQLFIRLDDAIAFQEQGRVGIDTYRSGQVHLGQLAAWQEGLPSVPEPTAVAGVLEVELEHSHVDATLSISSSGAISSVKVVTALPDDRAVKNEAVRAIREIRVRPALFEGKAKRLSLHRGSITLNFQKLTCKLDLLVSRFELDRFLLLTQLALQRLSLLELRRFYIFGDFGMLSHSHRVTKLFLETGLPFLLRDVVPVELTQLERVLLL